MEQRKPAPREENMQDSDIESTILSDLADSGPYSIDQLRERLPGCTWEQVFSAVCRLSLSGRLNLRQSLSFGYSVSLGKAGTASRNADQWASDRRENRARFDGRRSTLDKKPSTNEEQPFEGRRSKTDGKRQAGARR
jgi:hypothetical protein